MIAGRNQRTFVKGVLLLVALPLVGCERAAPGVPANRARAERVYRDDLFASAISSLNNLEEYDAAGRFSEIVQRMDVLQHPEKAVRNVQTDPLWASWPQPPALRQIVDRLKLWLQGASVDEVSWSRDPLIDGLSAPLSELPWLKRIDSIDFDDYDGFSLLEASWMRDVARWTHGDRSDDVNRAVRLFDWVMRNIGDEATESDGTAVAPQVAWEVLLYGRGSVWERAWVFILAARQLGIDAAVLATTDENGALKPWAVGVLSRDRVYVFDPVLRAPLPRKDGVRWSEGWLTLEPATLAELADNEELLRQLDAGGGAERPQSIRADQMQRITVLLEASPFSLSLRARLIEAKLTGADRMVLSVSPSAQAARWRRIPQVVEVKLWDLPFRVLHQRAQWEPQRVIQRLISLSYFYGDGASMPLRRGRLLHLKGRLVDDDGASKWYQLARPAEEDIRREFERFAAQEQKRIEQLPEAQRSEQIAQVSAFLNLQVRVAHRTKLDASFWLALVAFERERFPAARDYLERRVLPFDEEEVWTSAALYNLGRIRERMGDVSGALEIYRGKAPEAIRPAMLLRAQWLEKAGAGNQGS